MDEGFRRQTDSDVRVQSRGGIALGPQDSVHSRGIPKRSEVPWPSVY